MAYGKALQCLSDPTRRRVFERLRGGPKSVGVLATGLPVSRPAVSQHLKALKDAGLVKDRSEGTRRVYYIDPDGLGELRRWLDGFWDYALEAFRNEAEKFESLPSRKKP
jgi:DNA-binding transcriptional ArsR family regulator